MTHGSSSILTILAVAVFGLLVGALAASTLTNPNFKMDTKAIMSDSRSPGNNSAQVGIGGAGPDTNEIRKDMQSKAASMRLTLHSLLENHLNLTATSMRNSYDNADDLKAIQSSLSNNTQQIADFIQSYYGGEAATSFADVWDQHTKALQYYSVAMKKNNSDDREDSLNRLDKSAEAIGTYYAGINDQLPASTITAMMQDHISLLKNMINAYDAGDYSQSYSQQTSAIEAVGKMADSLADATIRKFPDKF